MAEQFTPVKIICSSIDDFCQICNLSLLTNGYGKLNLFEGESVKKLNIMARLSAVLGFPVNKWDDTSLLLCMECRRDLPQPVGKTANTSFRCINSMYSASSWTGFSFHISENLETAKVYSTAFWKHAQIHCLREQPPLLFSCKHRLAKPVLTAEILCSP